MLGGGRGHNLVELLHDALAADNLDALGIAAQGVEGLVFDVEVELGGKPDAAQHAQRVVREGDVGVEGGAYDAVLHIVHAVKGVYEFAEAVVVEADGKGVDGEIASVLVVFQRSVLDMRLAAVVAVAFLARTHKFYLEVAVLHLCGAEVAEYRQMRLASQLALEFFGHTDAASHDHHVDVIGSPLQKQVAHVSAHHIALHVQVVCHAADGLEYILVK